MCTCGDLFLSMGKLNNLIKHLNAKLIANFDIDLCCSTKYLSHGKCYHPQVVNNQIVTPNESIWKEKKDKSAINLSSKIFFKTMHNFSQPLKYLSNQPSYVYPWIPSTRKTYHLKVKTNIRIKPSTKYL